MLTVQNYRQEAEFSDPENPRDTQRERRENKSRNGLKKKYMGI